MARSRRTPLSPGTQGGRQHDGRHEDPQSGFETIINAPPAFQDAPRARTHGFLVRMKTRGGRASQRTPRQRPQAPGRPADCAISGVEAPAAIQAALAWCKRLAPPVPAPAGAAHFCPRTVGTSPLHAWVLQSSRPQACLAFRPVWTGRRCPNAGRRARNGAQRRGGRTPFVARSATRGCQPAPCLPMGAHHACGQL